MTANNRLIASAFAAALSLLPVSAGATLMRAASFDEKVENAQSIVLGRCIKTESRLDPTGRWILTYSTFRVEKSLKGGPATEVTVVTPGGHVGNRYQDTIGVPDFKAGDERVLFVKNAKVGPTVLYMDQGAYEVAKDDRGEKIIIPVASDAVKVDAQRGLAVAPESARSLRAFENDVRISLRRSEVQRMQVIERERAKQQASIGSVLSRNKLLIALALLGAALATWQLLRR
jgi:hypothetical protein